MSEVPLYSTGDSDRGGSTGGVDAGGAQASTPSRQSRRLAPRCPSGLTDHLLVDQPHATGVSRLNSAAHRGKSREWNVSKQKWNLCQLKKHWILSGLVV